MQLVLSKTCSIFRCRCQEAALRFLLSFGVEKEAQEEHPVSHLLTSLLVVGVGSLDIFSKSTK